MNTRTSPLESEAFAPERSASSQKIAGINVPLNIVARVARARAPEHTRSMIWATNYAKINGCSADALARAMDMDRADIRAALSDPDYDAAPFHKAVCKLRKEFESGLRPLAGTRGRAVVLGAFDYAEAEKIPVEIVGKWRSGKTWPAWEQFLHRMDRSVWLRCPSDDAERTFIFDLARAMSIGVGNGAKPGQLRPRISSCFGKGLIELLVIDEAHYLWPSSLRGRSGRMAKPKRLEFVRELYDLAIPAEIGVVLLQTPQVSDLMAEAIAAQECWAPGQWDGRADAVHLPEAMTDAELASIARWHEPALPDEALPVLIALAKASEGYVGKMVVAIKRARQLHGSVSRRAIAQSVNEISKKETPAT
jgi:hypothetical protein